MEVEVNASDTFAHSPIRDADTRDTRGRSLSNTTNVTSVYSFNETDSLSPHPHGHGHPGATKYAALKAVFSPATLQTYLITMNGPLQPFSRKCFATLLFADISGFTSLAAHLDEQTLKKHINIIFTNLLNIVQDYNGDVLKFCGDAVMIMWPVDLHAEDMVKQATAYLAGTCALRMLQKCGEYLVDEGDYTTSLPLHCGIGSGIVNCMCLGADNRWEFLIGGSPIHQISDAITEAVRGTVCMSQESYALVSEYFEVCRVTNTFKVIKPKQLARRKSVLKFNLGGNGNGNNEVGSGNNESSVSVSLSLHASYIHLGGMMDRAETGETSVTESPTASFIHPNSSHPNSNNNHPSSFSTIRRMSMKGLGVGNNSRYFPSDGTLGVGNGGGGGGLGNKILMENAVLSARNYLSLCYRSKSSQFTIPNHVSSMLSYFMMEPVALAITTLHSPNSSNHNHHHHLHLPSPNSNATNNNNPNSLPIPNPWEGLFHLAEIREVVTMFMQILDVEEDFHLGNITRPQFIISQVLISLSQYRGSLRQYIVDDKGCVIIAGFGVSGFANENNCANAVECAFRILKLLEEQQIVCKFGISRGSAFCGLVGSEWRYEYAMMGSSVNLAARLMSRAQAGSILVDKYVHVSTKTIFKYITIPKMKLKGYQKKVEVFSPFARSNVGDTSSLHGIQSQPITPRTSAESVENNFIGREIELGIFRRSLDSFFLTHSSQSHIIEGCAGVGKTWFVLKILNMIKFRIKEDSYFVTIPPGSHLLTHSTLLGILEQLFEISLKEFTRVPLATSLLESELSTQEEVKVNSLIRSIETWWHAHDTTDGFITTSSTQQEYIGISGTASNDSIRDEDSFVLPEFGSQHGNTLSGPESSPLSSKLREQERQHQYGYHYTKLLPLLYQIILGESVKVSEEVASMVENETIRKLDLISKHNYLVALVNRIFQMAIEERSAVLIIDNLHLADPASMYYINKWLDLKKGGFFIATLRSASTENASPQQNTTLEPSESPDSSSHNQNENNIGGVGVGRSSALTLDTQSGNEEMFYNFSEIYQKCASTTLHNFQAEEIRLILEKVIGTKHQYLTNEFTINNILSRTNGSPFLVQLLMKGLNKVTTSDGTGVGGLNGTGDLSGTVTQADLNAELEILPAGYKGLVLYEFDKLSNREQLIMKVASVVGYTFSEFELESVIYRTGHNQTYQSVSKSLSKLLGTNLIKRGCGMDGSGSDLYACENNNRMDDVTFGEIYSFADQSIHESIYKLMLDDQRQSLHNIVGQVLEELLVSQQVSRQHSSSSKALFQSVVHHYRFSKNKEKKYEYLVKAGKVARGAHDLISLESCYGELIRLYTGKDILSLVRYSCSDNTTQRVKKAVPATSSSDENEFLLQLRSFFSPNYNTPHAGQEVARRKILLRRMKSFHRIYDVTNVGYDSKWLVPTDLKNKLISLNPIEVPLNMICSWINEVAYAKYALGYLKLSHNLYMISIYNYSPQLLKGISLTQPSVTENVSNLLSEVKTGTFTLFENVASSARNVYEIINTYLTGPKILPATSVASEMELSSMSMKGGISSKVAFGDDAADMSDNPALQLNSNLSACCNNLAFLYLLRGKLSLTSYLLNKSKFYLDTNEKLREDLGISELGNGKDGNKDLNSYMEMGNMIALTEILTGTRAQQEHGYALLTSLRRRSDALGSQQEYLKISTYMTSSAVDFSCGNFRGCRLTLKKSIRICEISEKRFLKFICEIQLAWCLFSTGRISQASYLLESIIRYATLTGNQDVILTWAYNLDIVLKLFSGSFAAVTNIADMIRFHAARDYATAESAAVIALHCVLSGKLVDSIPHIRYAIAKYCATRGSVASGAGLKLLSVGSGDMSTGGASGCSYAIAIPGFYLFFATFAGLVVINNEARIEFQQQREAELATSHGLRSPPHVDPVEYDAICGKSYYSTLRLTFDRLSDSIRLGIAGLAKMSYSHHILKIFHASASLLAREIGLLTQVSLSQHGGDFDFEREYSSNVGKKTAGDHLSEHAAIMSAGGGEDDGGYAGDWKEFVVGNAFYQLLKSATLDGDKGNAVVKEEFKKLGGNTTVYNILIKILQQKPIPTVGGVESLGGGDHVRSFSDPSITSPSVERILSDPRMDIVPPPAAPGNRSYSFKAPAISPRPPVQTLHRTTTTYNEQATIGVVTKEPVQRHVLVVDDSLTVLKLCALNLTKAGYTVTTATNGAEAVNRVEQHLLQCLGTANTTVDALADSESSFEAGFYAILMDLQMPVMDGMEATAKIRQLESSYASRFPDLHQPIFAVSVCEDDTTRHQALQIGFDHYMVKPLKIALFEATLSKSRKED